MAISTQLVASLAAGGASITAVTVPFLGFRQTYKWGEYGKMYLVMNFTGGNISTSGSVGVSTNGNPMGVVSGPVTFSTGDTTYLCIEVATN